MRRTPLRRSRLRPKRATPRRREAPRWSAEEWQIANDLLMIRCRGRCELCGDPLGSDLERAHRVRRRDGGDRLANILALHSGCHRWTHSMPMQAQATGGWILSSSDDPAATPVLLWGRTWVLLDDRGGWTAA